MCCCYCCCAACSSLFTAASTARHADSWIKDFDAQCCRNVIMAPPPSLRLAHTHTQSDIVDAFELRFSDDNSPAVGQHLPLWIETERIVTIATLNHFYSVCVSHYLSFVSANTIDNTNVSRVHCACINSFVEPLMYTVPFPFSRVRMSASSLVLIVLSTTVLSFTLAGKNIKLNSSPQT